jgi:predicted ATPase/DNA-binding winged helix-turn-helix (wHTH) protein
MKEAFSFGPFYLHPGTRTLQKDGKAVALGSRAFDMLVAMVERHGNVLAPEELMAIAWPGLKVEDSNVRVQIANLRRTLQRGPAGAQYIANVAGRGYCFVAPVTRIESVDPPSPTTSDSRLTSAGSHVDGENQTSGSIRSFPPPLDGAIGREGCVAELVQVVNERRLVTVVGAAGAGKTTLAILVAHAIDSFAGSMCFVDLSLVDRDEMVAEAVASAVGYIPPTGDLLSGLLDVLSTRRLLIVLDNCEHVIAAAASLSQQIVQSARSVSLLNTSREALRVREEFVYLLRPLASPPATTRLTTTQALAWPAIQLFMERAKVGGARGVLSDEEAGTVASLCRRLDGNPHAIGLVASRVGAYGIQGVADLFASQFALQWQGRRDDTPRHQTVEALIDWSYNLLPERDRMVLQRLSVFSGDFPLRAAIAVTSDDAVDAFQVREAVGNLVDKSLVAFSAESGEAHLRLLETTKAYAMARLARLPEGNQFARRHAMYYADQLRAIPDNRATAQTGGAPLRTLDVANVRAALEWAFSAGHDAKLAVEMWCLAAPLFLELGLVRECKRTCVRSLDELPDEFRSTPTELLLMKSTAMTCFAGADYGAVMKRVLEHGLALSRQLGDNESTFHFLTGLHLQTITNGEFQNSVLACEQYSALAKESGGAPEAVIAGWMTGSSLHYTGDLVGADARFAESTQLLAQQGMRPLHYFELMEEIIAGINTARVKWALGMQAQALQLALNVIRAGHSMPGTLAMRVTLCFHILLSHGLYEQAQDLIEDLENLSIDYNTSVRRQVINVNKGFLLHQQGQHEAAIDHLQQCLAGLPPPKMSVVRTDALQTLAEAQRLSGNAAGALKAIDEAIELSEETKGKFNFPDLLRTRAEVLMSLPGVEQGEIEASLLLAESSARKQGALIWQLRVARTVANVQASEGKEKEAKDTLERIYSRFTEGFDTNDLKAVAQAIRYL